MKYEYSEQLNPKNQAMISFYIEKAGVSGTQRLKDFEKIFVVVVEDFEEFKLSLDKFSELCGNLLQVLIENQSLKDEYIDASHLQDYLLIGDDISWYIRRDPLKAGESLKSLINFSESLKRKLFDNNSALEKYPILKMLDQDERRLVFGYLQSSEVSNLTEKESIINIFAAIMSDFMKGNHYLDDMLNICSGFLKLINLQPEALRTDDFVQELIKGLESSSQQTSDSKIWWQNAKQLVSLYKTFGREEKDGSRYSPPLDANLGNSPKVKERITG